MQPCEAGYPGSGTAVQRDARPRDAQHVWHPGIIVETRVMVLVLLHDTKDASRGLASRSAGRHRRAHSPAVGVIDGHLLALDRHDRHDRLSCTALSHCLGRHGPRLIRRSSGRWCHSQHRQHDRSHEGHNGQRPPSQHRLGGLRRCESICHVIPTAMPPWRLCQRGIPTQRSTRNGAWFPVCGLRSRSADQLNSGRNQGKEHTPCPTFAAQQHDGNCWTYSRRQGYL